MGNSSSKGMRMSNNAELRTLSENEALSVVGNENLGFVVIANDDSRNPVLGYSDECFSQDMPDGLKWYLQAATSALLCPVDKSEKSVGAREADNFPDELPPMVTTKWNQSAPYNNLVPLNAKGNRYPAGCVAIALSQIMKYHSFPARGTGSNSYHFVPTDGANEREITEDFSATEYKWDLMRDSYSPHSYTDEEADAVSTLVYHVGVACAMQYNNSGSGALSNMACSAASNYFSYNPYMHFYYRDLYNSDEWMNMVKYELLNHGPLFYSGVDLNTQSGHAFVIDGYDSDGLVHVNWGWGGNSNGNFDISLLNVQGDSYSSQQQMFSLVLPDEPVAYASSLGSVNSIAITFYGDKTLRASFTGFIYNFSNKPFAGKVAMIALDEDGNQIVLKESSDLTMSFLTGNSVQLRSVNITDLPDGTYRFFIGSKDTHDTLWQPVRSFDENDFSCIVTKKGLTIDTLKVNDYEWTAIDDVLARKDKAETAQVYSLDGKLVMSSPSSTFSVDKLPSKGVFVVKKGDETVKVLR